jgi:hypothetical protein
LYDDSSQYLDTDVYTLTDSCSIIGTFCDGDDDGDRSRHLHVGKGDQDMNGNPEARLGFRSGSGTNTLLHVVEELDLLLQKFWRTSCS